MSVDPIFLQGGNMQDLSGAINWQVRPGIEVTASSQYETWKYPLLATGTKSDVATSFGLRFSPGVRKHDKNATVGAPTAVAPTAGADGEEQ
jgi:hypothetical protein